MNHYQNRYWKQINEEYHLMFTPFYDEICIIAIKPDHENQGFYDIIANDEHITSDEFFTADSLEDALRTIEDMVIEHYKDQINYYNTLLTTFQERK